MYYLQSLLYSPDIVVYGPLWLAAPRGLWLRSAARVVSPLAAAALHTILLLLLLYVPTHNMTCGARYRDWYPHAAPDPKREVPNFKPI